ncbi:glycosyltransferase family 4 protein [Paenibacillus sp. IB182496]|uniref:Glycosyltransferase family 4 protein n=1 Tax=Paenibacillus sabuli TaxID=2772509 RepID=A0A927GSH1_9BACL|nr:glycosyltransferase family 4 protein [Paenibacillus sabuli]MBD2846734.1 glycosyltransferase family 4 protein [Paenibacillus sabuli]
MKILFTFFNPSGGMETLNRTRCEALSRVGIECHLLYTNDGDGKKNIRAIPTFIFKDEDKINALIARENYDAIIVCSDIALLQQIKRMNYGGYIVFEIQGLGTYEHARLILEQMKAAILSSADGLLYPKTAHLVQMLTAAFPNKLHFCFDDPVDTLAFGYTTYPKKSFPIVAWIGRIEKNKNWREFLRIGSKLRERFPSLYLWLFDDAELFEKSELEDFYVLAAELGLSDCLIRQSNVPHELMADYLSLIGDSGGCLCSTSITEGFGYAVAEAMLCRCPVLSTNSDGVKAFVIPETTGMFYEIGDIDQAAELATTLMKNEALRSRIVNEAEMYIKARFSAEKYASHFCAMIKRLEKGQKQKNRF